MLAIGYSSSLPLDAGPCSQDAPSYAEIPVGTPGFLASSVAGGAVKFRRQSGHSLTNQLIARYGDTRIQWLGACIPGNWGRYLKECRESHLFKRR
jgi:hypothetical protein